MKRLSFKKDIEPLIPFAIEIANVVFLAWVWIGSANAARNVFTLGVNVATVISIFGIFAGAVVITAFVITLCYLIRKTIMD